MTKKEYIKRVNKYKDLLLKKSYAYDNSFAKPSHFGLSIETRILAGIDEKLHRLNSINAHQDDENPLTDLIGYMILLATYLRYKETINYENACDKLIENCSFIAGLYSRYEVSENKCLKCFIETPFDLENLNFIISKLILSEGE